MNSFLLVIMILKFYGEREIQYKTKFSAANLLLSSNQFLFIMTHILCMAPKKTPFEMFYENLEKLLDVSHLESRLGAWKWPRRVRCLRRLSGWVISMGSAPWQNYFTHKNK